jgi:hypothetical protein
VNGDATRPIGEGKKVIPHITNDLNAWGSGFVVALSKRWSEPERRYRKTMANTLPESRLGVIDFVQVEDDVTVVNMCSQHDIRPSADGIPPIRYDVLRKCLKEVNQYCQLRNATVHAPRFGAGLSGGSWEIIEQIIKDEITVNVIIYDYVDNTFGAPVFKK